MATTKGESLLSHVSSKRNRGRRKSHSSAPLRVPTDSSGKPPSLRLMRLISSIFFTIDSGSTGMSGSSSPVRVRHQ